MNEGKSLRDHLRQVGEAKAETRTADIAAHLALSPGERLERVAHLSDTMRALSLAAGRSGSPPDDTETWVHVQRHLRGHAAHG